MWCGGDGCGTVGCGGVGCGDVGCGWWDGVAWVVCEVWGIGCGVWGVVGWVWCIGVWWGGMWWCVVWVWGVVGCVGCGGVGCGWMSVVGWCVVVLRGEETCAPYIIKATFSFHKITTKTLKCLPYILISHFPINLGRNPYMSPYVETVSCGEFFLTKIFQKSSQGPTKVHFVHKNK